MSDKTPHIIVKRKPFDPDYYKWRAELAIKMNRRDREKILMVKNLITRAYEQGVMDGKNDQDYYSDY
jgi:hypothetical protein